MGCVGVGVVSFAYVHSCLHHQSRDERLERLTLESDEMLSRCAAMQVRVFVVVRGAMSWGSVRSAEVGPLSRRCETDAHLPMRRMRRVGSASAV